MNEVLSLFRHVRTYLLVTAEDRRLQGLFGQGLTTSPTHGSPFVVSHVGRDAERIGAEWRGAELQAGLEKRMRELMNEAGDPGDTAGIAAYRESRRPGKSLIPCSHCLSCVDQGSVEI